MIEDRLVLMREDFLDLRESRNSPQNTSGIITAIKDKGVFYSTGVFPTSAERSFVKALEGADCCEILGNLNSIVIPYICGDTSDAFAEILEIHQSSFGMIDEFCFVRENNTRIYTPTKDCGIIFLQSIPYAVAGEKRMDISLTQFLREQRQSFSSYLGSVSSAVESH